MPGVDTVVEGDNLLRYVLFSNGHDGNTKLHVLPTAIRVVCKNTQRMAIAGDLGVKHTGDMSGKMDNVKLHLSQYSQRFTMYREQAQSLTTKRIGSIDATEFIRSIFPAKSTKKGAQTRQDNIIAAIRKNVRNERNRVPANVGSMWELYNGITEYIDHDTTFQGEDDRAKAEKRFSRTIDGDLADKKDAIWNKILQLGNVPVLA